MDERQRHHIAYMATGRQTAFATPMLETINNIIGRPALLALLEGFDFFKLLIIESFEVCTRVATAPTWNQPIRWLRAASSAARCSKVSFDAGANICFARPMNSFVSPDSDRMCDYCAHVLSKD